MSWADLLSHPEVQERSVLAGRLGLMAFHGGLELGTAEIAEEAAASSGASLYVVSQPATLRWHVPSHRVDPATAPRLAEWLTHVEVAVALHGYGRIGQGRRILLGGSNRALAATMEPILSRWCPGLSVVADLEQIPLELRGLHPDNPVNRPVAGGVQVELPPSARDPLLAPEGPGQIVAALAEMARSHRDGSPNFSKRHHSSSS